MSIRRRLARLLVAAIVPLVIACNVAVYFFVRQALLASLDDGLSARASVLSASVKLEPEGLELDASPVGMSLYASADSGEFFEVWRLDTPSAPSLAFASDSLQSREIRPRVLDQPGTRWSARVERGPSVRVASLALQVMPQPHDEDDQVPHASAAPVPPGGVPVVILVARSDQDYRSALGLLGAALTLGGLVLILGVLAAVWHALQRGLAPIATLASEVSAIKPEDPGTRVQEAGLPRELAPLAKRTNQLLSRVHTAIQRERSLAASAAHELRTPIAEVRAISELALQRERPPQEYRRALDKVLTIADRMGAAAGAVLRLARVQSGREACTPEPVDLRALIQPSWARWVDPLAERDVRQSLTLPARTRVLGDPAMLRVVFDNLCANIAEHTPPGGRVTLALIDDPRALDRVAAANGSGTPSATASTPSNGMAGFVGVRLANSVTSADAAPPSRSRDTDQGSAHAGLGLVTAEQMLRAQGGRMHAGRENGEFVATLLLPRAGDGAVQPR